MCVFVFAVSLPARLDSGLNLAALLLFGFPRLPRALSSLHISPVISGRLALNHHRHWLHAGRDLPFTLPLILSALQQQQQQQPPQHLASLLQIIVSSPSLMSEMKDSTCSIMALNHPQFAVIIAD